MRSSPKRASSKSSPALSPFLGNSSAACCPAPGLAGGETYLRRSKKEEAKGGRRSTMQRKEESLGRIEGRRNHPTGQLG